MTVRLPNDLPVLHFGEVLDPLHTHSQQQSVHSLIFKISVKQISRYRAQPIPKKKGI